MNKSYFSQTNNTFSFSFDLNPKNQDQFFLKRVTCVFFTFFTIKMYVFVILKKKDLFETI